jgi:hypothetical protein
MAGELDFGALHSDDRLLDALAARHDYASDDPIAHLLAAFAADVDTVPVPLSQAFGADGLLAPPMSARPGASEATAVADVLAAGATGGGVLTAGPELDTDSYDAAPAVPLAGRRRRRMMLPRAAAITGVAALVLGAGGVAAAVGEGSGPIERFKSVVASVAEQVSPNHSREDRVAGLLLDAEAALKSANAEKAAGLLAEARTRLSGMTGDLAGSLAQQLVLLEGKVAGLEKHARTLGNTGVSIVDRTHPQGSLTIDKAPAATGSPAATKGAQVPAQTFAPLPESPADATESPADARADGITHHLPGPDLGNPADNLPGGNGELPAEGKIGETEADLAKKTKEVPRPLPDKVDSPVGPVEPWRSPSSIGILDDPTVKQAVVDVAPSAGAAANGVTGGRP